MSPTPWKIADDNSGNTIGILDATGKTVCTIYADCETDILTDNDHDNAAKIVAYVNSCGE